MVFPDDEREARPTSFKFLQTAHAWKQMQMAKTTTATTDDTEMKNGDSQSVVESASSESGEDS
jgi:hypothetical protein